MSTTDGVKEVFDETRRQSEGERGIDLIGTSSEVSSCCRGGFGEKRTVAADFDDVVAVDSARSGGGR